MKVNVEKRFRREPKFSRISTDWTFGVPIWKVGTRILNDPEMRAKLWWDDVRCLLPIRWLCRQYVVIRGNMREWEILIRFGHNSCSGEGEGRFSTHHATSRPAASESARAVARFRAAIVNFMWDQRIDIDETKEKLLSYIPLCRLIHEHKHTKWEPAATLPSMWERERIASKRENTGSVYYAVCSTKGCCPIWIQHCCVLLLFDVSCCLCFVSGSCVSPCTHERMHMVVAAFSSSLNETSMIQLLQKLFEKKRAVHIHTIPIGTRMSLRYGVASP